MNRLDISIKEKKLHDRKDVYKILHEAFSTIKNDSKSLEDELSRRVHMEFLRAKEKYSDNKFPWNSDSFDIFQKCALVNVEAGEALQAANKFVFNNEGSIKDIEEELIQTISTAIRVLLSIKEK